MQKYPSDSVGQLGSGLPYLFRAIDLLIRANRAQREQAAQPQPAPRRAAARAKQPAQAAG